MFVFDMRQAALLRGGWLLSEREAFSWIVEDAAMRWDNLETDCPYPPGGQAHLVSKQTL